MTAGVYYDQLYDTNIYSWLEWKRSLNNTKLGEKQI